MTKTKTKGRPPLSRFQGTSACRENATAFLSSRHLALCPHISYASSVCTSRLLCFTLCNQVQAKLELQKCDDPNALAQRSIGDDMLWWRQHEKQHECGSRERGGMPKTTVKPMNSSRAWIHQYLFTFAIISFYWLAGACGRICNSICSLSRLHEQWFKTRADHIFHCWFLDFALLTPLEAPPFVGHVIPISCYLFLNRAAGFFAEPGAINQQLFCCWFLSPMIKWGWSLFTTHPWTIPVGVPVPY